jgi:hypothetical protein
MTLHEGWATVNAPGAGRLVFILDASESAASYRQATTALVREVLAALPATGERAVYFLGNPTAYASHQFASRAAQWFMENRRRASLGTPIWETLSQNDMPLVVVIGAGRIFDLEDWADTTLARRMLLISMGESMQGGAAIAEEVATPTVQNLLQRLHDPVVRVELSGPGFMPVWWDNAGYQLHLTGGEATLVAAERREDYTLTVRFLTTQAGKGQATITRASGTSLSEPLASVDPTTLAVAKAERLSTQEVDIFRKAVNRETFTCLHCGKPHHWHTLRCLEGVSILGQWVYPSLESRKAAGFVFFQTDGDGVRFEVHPCTILRLNSEEVAIREGQQAVVHRIDGQAGWVRTVRVLDPYHPIGEQTYAVLL